MVWLTILCVTTATLALPFVVARVARARPDLRLRPSFVWLPLVAAALFVIAWILPVVPISPETTTFQQHFVGGGLFCAVLFVYAKLVFGRRIGLVPSFLLLFAWVSAFGVANELFEFTLTELRIADIKMSDMGWDLTANTLGAFTGYLILWVCRVERSRADPPASQSPVQSLVA